MPHRFVAAACMTLFATAPALAQAVNQSRDKLTVVADVNGGFESALPPEFRSQAPKDKAETSGASSMLHASAEYTRTRRQVVLGGTASTAFSYYQPLNRVVPVSHGAGLGAAVRLPK